MANKNDKEYFKESFRDKVGKIYDDINNAKDGAKTAKTESELEVFQQKFNAAMGRARKTFNEEYWQKAQSNIKQMEKIVAKRQKELAQMPQAAQYTAPIPVIETGTPQMGTTPTYTPQTAPIPVVETVTPTMGTTPIYTPQTAPIPVGGMVTPTMETMPIYTPQTAPIPTTPIEPTPQTNEELRRENAMLKAVVNQQKQMIETLMKPLLIPPTYTNI